MNLILPSQMCIFAFIVTIFHIGKRKKQTWKKFLFRFLNFNWRCTHEERWNWAPRSRCHCRKKRGHSNPQNKLFFLSFFVAFNLKTFQRMNRKFRKGLSPSFWHPTHTSLFSLVVFSRKKRRKILMNTAGCDGEWERKFVTKVIFSSIFSKRRKFLT